jgi:geranylgeranyl pyrophosphate synthase
MNKKQLFKFMKETAGDIDNYTTQKLQELKDEDKKLYQIVVHLVLLRKNKPKLRATFGRLIYEYLGGKDWHDILPILSFIELSTISTYVLDDIIDNQPEREGKEATWKKFGLNYGIVAGSLQTFLSIKMLSDLKLEDSLKLKILELANQMWDILWKGEGKNEHMKDNTTYEKYIERCYEICGVMFEIVAKMSAVACNSKMDDIENMGKIGRLFGIAVMIRNDLTIFLPEEIMRKKSKALSRLSFEDVRKGIWTYPVICGMEKASKSDEIQIRNLLGKKEASEKELLNLTKLLIQLGCINETLDQITSYKRKGLDCVNKLAECNSRTYLIELFKLLENTRDYVKEFQSKI